MNYSRSQSAVEFLSVYGFVLLIIGIVIAGVALYISLPASTVPFECAFYGGFSCSDALMVTNSGGSALLIEAVDSQPGVVATFSFNSVLDSMSSTTGYCLPQNVIQGQTIYCIANFIFAPNPTVAYSGTFSLAANYCASAPQNVSTVACIPSSNTIYGGDVRVQPTANANSLTSIISNAPTTVNYIPITIVNSQSAPSSAPFQQEITFLPSNTAFNSFESGNLGNIRFYYYNIPLPSWCEINCEANSVYNAIFWVRMPGAIQPSSNIVIYMEFMANTVNYDGVYAGEAPNQSTTYGQYDNGNVVFDFYDDFAGSSISSKWTVSTFGYGSETVNNGIQMKT